MWLFAMQAVLTLAAARLVAGDAAFAEFAPNLYLGACAAAHDWAALQARNITRVLSVAPRAECAQPFAHHVRYTRLDLEDDG